MITSRLGFPINYRKVKHIGSLQQVQFQKRVRVQKNDSYFPVRKDPLKRVFDIVFSSLFIILASPLFLVLTALIDCTSNGPIFYKSRRVGLCGKLIDCWKFRSMHCDAEERLHKLLSSNEAFRTEWEKFQKLKNDPRITWVGKFLRKTSLDEIPQFWNVLKGDLSVVGPRPPSIIGPPEKALLEIRQLYKDKTETILSVRPGITGLWQISGRSQISFEERCAIEERYALHHTFLQDLWIIAKTLPAVFLGKGAF